MNVYKVTLLGDKKETVVADYFKRAGKIITFHLDKDNQEIAFYDSFFVKSVQWVGER